MNNIAQFEITPEYLKSQGCSSTVVDRFWSKVFFDTTERGCWLWIGKCKPKKWRYGEIWSGTRYAPAHRISWIINRGPIPEGLLVLHSCDNPQCVRPDHLFIGTSKDNTQDMMSKGRHVIGVRHRGELNHNSVLKSLDVFRIRQACSSGMSQSKVAKKFGTSQTNVSAIVRRKTWDYNYPHTISLP